MAMATATFPSEPSTAAVEDDEVAGAGVGSVGETLEVGLSSIVLERLQWAAEENENDATEGRMMMFRCAIILI